MGSGGKDKAHVNGLNDRKNNDFWKLLDAIGSSRKTQDWRTPSPPILQYSQYLGFRVRFGADKLPATNALFERCHQSDRLLVLLENVGERFVSDVIPASRIAAWIASQVMGILALPDPSGSRQFG